MSLPHPPPSSPLPDLLAELAAILAGADAELALELALERLAQLGMTRAPDAATAWLSIMTTERSLHLTASSLHGAELKVPLAGLLKLGLLRASEWAEHRRLRERFDMLSEASFEGILVHSNGVVLDVNRRAAEMVGCEPHELLGTGAMYRMVAPEDLPEALERVKSGYEGAYTLSLVRKDGSRLRAELLSKQGRLGDRPVRIAAVRDVTDREHTLSLLREVENYLNDLSLGAFDFMVVSQDGQIVEVGGKVEQLLGYAREEMLGRHVTDFVTPETKQVTADVVSNQVFGAYENVVVAKSGELIPVEIIGVRSTRNGKPARVAGFRDLREARRLQGERRKLEQQLQRSQRLDSLGVLAGGIAHDFNNLLVGVIGNASLLLATLEQPLDRQAVEAILSAGQRAAALTKQMLAYAGRQDLGRREPVDLGQLFRELRTLLDATLSKKATLTLDIEEGSVVIGDRAPLTQVMMNVLANASDSLLDQPGKIDVRTRHVRHLDVRWDDALGASVGPGDWVLIEVEDTGVGMDEATRQRVFEPFFTTKEHGHGLGLAACLGIVTSHGGALALESTPGEGSRFSILLPATAHPERVTSLVPTPEAIQPCRVLVIDDEQLVRAQLRRSLELRGYQVDEACDGESGVAAQLANPADVLVIDMTMPDIDGAEVVRRIRASGSRAAIVLSSGYQAKGAAERLEAGAFQYFLPKPYGVGELVAAVEQARARLRWM